MASATESAPIEGFANLTLNDEGESEEDEDSGEKQDDNEWDGYLPTDERIYPKLFEDINSTDRSLRLATANKIRQLLQSQGRSIEAVVQPVIDSGVLPAILAKLSPDDPEFLFEATWILINITAGSTEQASKVVESGALLKLIPLFPRSSDSIKDNILMTVGNILGDSKHLRQVAIREGGFKLALDVMRAPEDHSASCVASAAWAMATALTLEHGDFPDDGLAAQMIPVLTTFIQNQGDDVSESLVETVRALRQLSIHRDMTTAISESGVTRQIVRLCTEKDRRLRNDALRLVIHMGGGGEWSVKALVKASCLSTLDSCAAEQALSGGTALEDIALRSDQSLMELPLLPRILRILSPTEVRSLRADATALTMNLAQMAAINFEILDLMVEANYLEALSQASLSDDSGRLEINLHALEQILNAKWDGRQRAVERFNASDGPRRLRDLRVRRDTRKTAVATVARRVLQTHFPEFSKWPRV